MSNIFEKIKGRTAIIDECVNPRLAQHLKICGTKIVAIQMSQYKGQSDDKIAKLVADRKKTVLITSDRAFHNSVLGSIYIQKRQKPPKRKSRTRARQKRSVTLGLQGLETLNRGKSAKEALS